MAWQALILPTLLLSSLALLPLLTGWALVRRHFRASIPPGTNMRLAYVRIGRLGAPLALYCTGAHAMGLALRPIWPLDLVWGTAVIPWKRVLEVSADLGLNRGPYWLKVDGGPMLGLDANTFDCLRPLLKGEGVPGSY